jgi:hypothetical protein
MRHLLEYEQLSEGVYHNLLGTVYFDKFECEDFYRVWHTWYSPYAGSNMKDKFENFMKEHGIKYKKLRTGSMIMDEANVKKMKAAINKPS